MVFTSTTLYQHAGVFSTTPYENPMQRNHSARKIKGEYSHKVVNHLGWNPGVVSSTTTFPLLDT